MSIVDVDMPFYLGFAVGGPIICCSNIIVLAIVTWQVLVVSIPMVYIAIHLQVIKRFFFEIYCNSEMASSLFLISIDTY